MAKKAITFEKILSTLKDLVQKVDEGYNISFDKGCSTDDETERFWAKADEGRYGEVSDKLWEIIYQVEDWVQI